MPVPSAAADLALDFVTEMCKRGFPSVVIYLDEADSVRMVTPKLPVEAMTLMLEQAQKTYAAQLRKALN